jgi:outer membrane immunogenic protein
MKKLLLSATALVALTAAAGAADLPLRSAPSPLMTAVPIFSWTGFYAGVQAGYAWGDDETRLFFNGVPLDTIPVIGAASTDYDADGFVGGAHVGYNVQVGSFVLGVEGDLEVADIDGDRRWASVVFPGAFASAKSEINFQGSIRSRFGFAFDRALVYGTAGLAFANIENTYSTGDGAVTAIEKFDETQWGWTVGAGVEYAFTNNLTGRVEYRYTKFGDYRNNTNLIVVGGSTEQELDLHTVRAGLSYKFSTY